MIETLLRDLLSDGRLLSIWLVIVVVSLLFLLRDFKKYNDHIDSLMKVVWFLTVTYSGPIGLWLYFTTGRKQIRRDSVWRQGVRSLAHCYSGCGAGEVTGIVIAAGLLTLGNNAVALITFAFAYIFGYGLTFGPLVQAGIPIKRALIDTFYSDTLTIAVMEVTAISLDIWLAADATMGEPLFWGSLIFSLSIGLVAAYPVNVLLVHFGVKGGMGDPRDTQSSHAHHH
ncbi:DUF4396 domain-containing protein [Thiohalophilus sp.]|uniref:DUF4396 domain-containing protein n=1 Tax=Thiohalophilus sp. TaxID=3028392 RepID=UPI003975F707